MRTLLVIGIGAGDPDHVTMQAVKALNRVDVFLLPDKGADKDGLRALRREVCRRFIDKGRSYRFAEMAMPEREILPGVAYQGGIEAWRADVTAGYERFIGEEVADGQCGGFLVWGDPAIYDGTIRILDDIRAKGTLAFEIEVIPGISSVAALAARHRVALNRIGESIQITTGRRLEAGWPAGADNLVVMLDGRQAYERIAEADVEIFWGAYVGSTDEILISGPLPETAAKISAARAAAQAKHGWIMDSYLLRKKRRS